MYIFITLKTIITSNHFHKIRQPRHKETAPKATIQAKTKTTAAAKAMI
jgi:hypothetical protein